MASKESKLNAEIKRQQKNARNKLYRLRKKGIVNASISQGFGGVLPLKEVHKMETWQKTEYLESLRAFNSRVNAYAVPKGRADVYMQSNKVAVDVSKLSAFHSAQNQVNAARVARARQIEESRLAILARKQFNAAELARLRNVTIQDERSLVERFPALGKLERTSEFTSEEALEKAVSGLERLLEEKPYSREQHIINWKESLYNRFSENGQYELAMAVDQLAPLELDYLYYYTDFASLSEMFVYRQEWLEGHSVQFGYELNDEAALLMEDIQAVRG